MHNSFVKIENDFGIGPNSLYTYQPIMLNSIQHLNLLLKIDGIEAGWC